MRVAFLYEGRTAQIILTPITIDDESQINLIRQHISESISVKLGDDKSFIVQFSYEDTNGTANPKATA